MYGLFNAIIEDFKNRYFDVDFLLFGGLNVLIMVFIYAKKQSVR